MIFLNCQSTKHHRTSYPINNKNSNFSFHFFHLNVWELVLEYICRSKFYWAMLSKVNIRYFKYLIITFVLAKINLEKVLRELDLIMIFNL